MWDKLFTLLSYSLVMGVASFFAGYLPLSFGLSQNHSRIISAIGTGLLVGTCLIIIIPEGIETLYSAHSSAANPTSEFDPHAWIGISLTAGFILMHLIDELPKHTPKSASQLKPLHISLANLSQGPHREASPTRAEATHLEEEVLESPTPTPGSSSTTIGLVIHAAADGVALAASSFLSEASTGLIVFLALMIHKAPAAFGLTSVLLKQGLTKRQAKAHLLVFSLAAPAGAIVTYVLVNMLAGGHIEGEESTKFATGLLLLFSGGTFLYVAMHTMREHGEVGSSESSSSSLYSNGQIYHSESAATLGHQKTSLRDTLLGVIGMLLPLVAQIGHAH